MSLDNLEENSVTLFGNRFPKFKGLPVLAILLSVPRNVIWKVFFSDAWNVWSWNFFTAKTMHPAQFCINASFFPFLLGEEWSICQLEGNICKELQGKEHTDEGLDSEGKKNTESSNMEALSVWGGSLFSKWKGRSYIFLVCYYTCFIWNL